MTWFALFFLFYAHQVAECITVKNRSRPAPESLTDSMMVCEKGWYSFSSKCYKLGGRKYIGKLTFDKALEHCQDDGGSLVAIQNQETQDFVRVILLELQGNLWIGLHDRENETEYTWVDGTKFNYSNWKPGEPSGPKYENEDCTEMLFLVNDGESGQWNDVKCDAQLPFICQKDPIKYSVVKAPLDPIFCSDENNSGYKFHNSCYNLVTEKKTWMEAEAYCKNEYSGHLVSVRDFSVDLFLDYVLRGFNEDIWIGIPIKEDFTQKWSNGFFVGYNGWGKGKRDFVEGTCATRAGSRRWSIADCTRKFAFVCEQTSDNPIVLTQTIKESFCPSEPDDWRDLGGDMCYFFDFEKTVTWYEANFMCMFRGGNLVSIHSKQESDVLHEFIIHTKRELHIGLHRQLQGGKDFAWSDKSELDWINWDSGEPNRDHENCAEILTFTMKWNDVVCDLKKGYICSIRKIAPKLITITNLTVEKLSQGRCSDCISSGTFTAVLVCIFLILVVLGALLAYYFKPWIRKDYRNNSIGSINILSDGRIQSYRPGNSSAKERNDIPEQYEVT
ncbi:macrophage mannose receptor 1-like isoform X2 [Uloborus diversus]|uniref:macrophage mannose receptor 1-like isoform X2 n=1 Tax=Uloborus diversus TaxID=327109 RepID=UPI002408FD6B|nr:macrophage mannose receptor 1-like isoform X2 [Uloborus diversus]